MNEIQQLRKFDPETGQDKDIFPVSKIEAILGLKQKLNSLLCLRSVLPSYASGNSWRSTGSSVSYAYPVSKGSIIYYLKDPSNKVPYVSLVRTIDLNTSPGLIVTYNTSSEKTFTVPEDCFVLFVIQYSREPGQTFAPSQFTINNQDVLNNDFYLKPVEDVFARSEISLLYDVVRMNKQQADELFSEIIDPRIDVTLYPFEQGSFETNKYWNLVDGRAGLVNSSRYQALSELVQVNQGLILEFLCSNDVEGSTIIGTAAYSAYDNDRLPYNGSHARINFSANDLVSSSDEGDVFVKTIPTNCTLVGIYAKLPSSSQRGVLSIKLKSSNSFQIADPLKQAIISLIEEYGPQGSTEEIIGPYYLKGQSQKSYVQKIGIIAAGQSNIDGRVPNSELPSYISQPISNCLYVKNNATQEFQPINITGAWAFDLILYHYLSQVADIYVVKHSEGGTSLDLYGDSTHHWTPDYETLSLNNSLCRLLENSIRSHKDTQFDFRAIVWHQGEGDRGSLGTGSADRYYSNLKKFISYIRGVVSNSRLPFITGTISHHSAQFDSTIEAAQQRLASEDPYFYLIDMSGATLRDSYHFDAASSIYFGEQCYNCFIEAGIIQASPINSTRPW